MYIHRVLEQNIVPFLKKEEVISIKGPRQAGKTFFYQQLANESKNAFFSVQKKDDSYCVIIESVSIAEMIQQFFRFTWKMLKQ